MEDEEEITGKENEEIAAADNSEEWFLVAKKEGESVMQCDEGISH